MRVYLVDIGSDTGETVHPIVAFSEDLESKSDLFAEYQRIREKLLAKAPLDHKVNLRWVLVIAEVDPDEPETTQGIFYSEYARSPQQNRTGSTMTSPPHGTSNIQKVTATC